MSSSRSAPDRAKGQRWNTKKEKASFEREPETHAQRAAQLLARARASNPSRQADVKLPLGSVKDDEGAKANGATGTPPRPPVQRVVASGPSSERSDVSDVPIPLPMILKSLANPALGASAFAVKEAIPLAGKLVRAKLNTQTRLSHLNEPVLEDAGITSELERHKIMIAFGVRQVGQKRSGKDAQSKALSELSGGPSKRSTGAQAATATTTTTTKRRRTAYDDDERLSREYGNVTAPPDEIEAGAGEAVREYEFNEVLQEEELRGRYAYVNRAPIMTAWTTIVLERLGFKRREALSIAHCYVNTTSTARGISLGLIPASERTRAVHTIGSNQPQFELMGLKIPLMKLRQTDEWRGISAGQVVSPDQAFNYMRRSMFQTLPVVIGALTLLADSYVNATNDDVKREHADDDQAPFRATTDVASPDLLHARAYELYTQFRPETAGEWGKKSQFYCSKALALRRGHEDEWDAWQAASDGDQLEAQAFEEELKALVQQSQAGAEGVGTSSQFHVDKEEEADMPINGIKREEVD